MRCCSRYRTALLVALCLFALCVWSMPRQRKKQRPRTDERVYLLHSDELKYDMYGANPGAQIVKGKVSFRHKGARLWCDSAYFYQEANAVKAFGHVRFVQGDTLSLTCDYADYDGQTQQMSARNHVVMKHRRQTLHTDSLNYDRLYNYAYFFEGGTLVDGKDRLVSDWGEYHTDTRQAVFYYNVKMRSTDRLITTDTLYYDTTKSLAHVVGPKTRITSGASVVDTEDAYYDTKTDKARLYGRSTVVDRQKTITGDTLLYVKNGDSHGYGNVVYVDKENRNAITCDEFVYNEKTGYGYATKRALVKDYSQKDTLYAHADTMKIYTFNINTDSVFRKVHCYAKVRVFRPDVQAVCDSLVYNSKDSCMIMYHDPIVWNGGRQLLGEVIKVYLNDSTVRQADVNGQALSIEQLADQKHFNQISSRDMFAYFKEGKLRMSKAVGNVRSVYYPVDDKDSSLIGLDYMETDTMKMFLSEERKLEKIWVNKPQGTLYPITQIPPGKEKLDVFAWFDYIRPTDKDDVFKWRGKGGDNTLKIQKRQKAPLQHLNPKPTNAPPSPTEPPAGEKGVSS